MEGRYHPDHRQKDYEFLDRYIVGKDGLSFTRGRGNRGRRRKDAFGGGHFDRSRQGFPRREEGVPTVPPSAPSCERRLGVGTIGPRVRPGDAEEVAPLGWVGNQKEQDKTFEGGPSTLLHVRPSGGCRDRADARRVAKNSPTSLRL